MYLQTLILSSVRVVMLPLPDNTLPPCPEGDAGSEFDMRCIRVGSLLLLAPFLSLTSPPPLSAHIFFLQALFEDEDAAKKMVATAGLGLSMYSAFVRCQALVHEEEITHCIPLFIKVSLSVRQRS